MLLEHKVAVIYGGAGAIGRGVARVFAREGALVFLAGRTETTLDAVANEIRASGGSAETAVVDALDEAAVDAFVDGIVRRTNRIDISFNLISVGDVQQPLMDITVDNFLQPVLICMRSQFLTTRAAARHMIRQHSGVVLAFGGDGHQTLAGLGGFKISLDALEGLRRQWACELGAYGVRVVTLKTGGIPETLPANLAQREQIAASIEQSTLLKRVATLEDVGKVAAFVASDHAQTITATEINISCGALMD